MDTINVEQISYNEGYSNGGERFCMSILSNLQTKKLGLFELIAMGFDLYLKHFRSFFSLLCIVMPFSIILNIIALYLPSNPILWIPFWLFWVPYMSVMSPAYTGAVAILTEGHILGEKHHLNVAIRRVLSRIVPLSGLTIRFAIVSYIRLFLFIIPSVIYYINNNYYALAFILRDQRGKAAFQYSRSLVKGNWWKVFFFNLLIFIITVRLPMSISQVLINIIANSPTLVIIFSNILSSLVGLGVVISEVLLFLNLDFQKR